MEEELEAHFRTLCQNYENILDDTIDLTQPIDERVGLGLFKIDEACTLSDKVRQDAQISKGRILKILSSNCEELEKIFMRLNHIDSFVSKVYDLTKNVEKRMELVNQSANSTFRSGSVSSLLRSLSLKRDQSHAAYAKWEHMDISLDVDKTVERLRKHRDL